LKAKKKGQRRSPAHGGRPLIIVESPAKARTIEKALGRSYRVSASLGHLRDLPRSQLGVDVSQDFEPKYITVRGRGEVARSLRAASGSAKKTLLAADPDREGEAISWHLAHLLDLDPASPCRIVFHEITREAIAEAVRHPRPVDMDLVDAQQARRVLDRLVGYELSPLLWRKVRKGLSAGRVQSVAVRLVCEREADIKAFRSEESWTIEASLTATPPPDKPVSPFPARLAGRLDATGQAEKVEVKARQEADDIVRDSLKATWTVLGVRRGTRRRNPPAPFITSTLQQEAANRLGFTVRRTMAIAQQLYEGVELGEAGPVGLITYMRTDATRVAESAREQVRAFVTEALSGEYLPETPPKHKVGRRAQQAHEAIRPTDPSRVPGSIRPFATDEQFRLYRVIWERFLASEMARAVYATVSADFAAGEWRYRSSGSEIRFPGFLAAYDLGGESPDPDVSAAGEEAPLSLPELHRGQSVFPVELTPEQHFTVPPPRYNEATLVRAMEELGIGRPSTYAPTIETISSRGYVEKVEGRLAPTKLGEIVTGILLQHFPGVINVAFTAELEDQLDRVEDGTLPWRKVVRRFYEPFAAALKTAEEELGRVEVPLEESGLACEACGRPMVVKYGRFGRFLACLGYPECRQTRPYVIPTGATCPRCGGEVVEKRTKKGRRFYGCIRYPECDFSVWSRPSDRRCAECGSFLVVAGKSETQAEGNGSSLRLRCAREGCGYEESAPPSPG
jgi:DNA topoisomerase-1